MQIVKVQLKAINSSGLLFVWLTWHNLHIVCDRAQLATKTEPQQQDYFLYVIHIISQVVLLIIAQTTPPPANDDDSFVSHSQSYTEQYELYILLFAIIARHQPTTTTLLGDQPSWERNKVQPQ